MLTTWPFLMDVINLMKKKLQEHKPYLVEMSIIIPTFLVVIYFTCN